ncbi:MAG: ATP-binding protein [Thermoanaerobaculia bacterium]|nr:ATP-binding protein [Thermoanaerobaculia bacterium]
MLKTRSARSAELAQKALDLLDEGILVFDRRDRLCLMNRAAESAIGMPRQEVLGRAVRTVLERLRGLAARPGDLEAMERHLDDTTNSVSLEVRLTVGHRLRIVARPMFDADRPAGRLWRLRRLGTDRPAEDSAAGATAEVRALDSLGVLAGGVAHDFNNLLSTILGHTELGLEDVDADSEVAESLRSIARVAERASQLTQQMLAYAGKGTVLVEPIDLSRVVRDVLELLSVSLRPGVELAVALADDLPPIIADAVQIRQVVMNLVLNASEALEERGTIEISTGVHRLGEREIAAGTADAGISPGEFVYLEVADSGHGIDEATLERIFDPFFSTKFTGRGLGLAAVHGIVRGHGGLVRVVSRPGRGTTFTVDLPQGYEARSPGSPAPP